MKHALRFCLLMLIASTASLAAPISIKSPITAVEKQKVDAFLNGHSALQESEVTNKAVSGWVRLNP